jgi:hypothetical protein
MPPSESDQLSSNFFSASFLPPTTMLASFSEGSINLVDSKAMKTKEFESSLYTAITQYSPSEVEMWLNKVSRRSCSIIVRAKHGGRRDRVHQAM